MTHFVDLRLGLREYILDDPDIVSMINDRRFPIVLPQGEKRTSLIYTRVSGAGDHHMQSPSGLNRPRYQIDAWSGTPSAANELADMVKERIDGFRGVMPYGTDSPNLYADVLGVFYTDERDAFENEAVMYRVSRDYVIWYRDYNSIIAAGAGFAGGEGG